LRVKERRSDNTVSDLIDSRFEKIDIRVYGRVLNGWLRTGSCSIMSLRHNLFYVDNTSQVPRGSRGTLSEKVKTGLVEFQFLILLSQVGGTTLVMERCMSICTREI